jgi:transposase-like protein
MVDGLPVTTVMRTIKDCHEMGTDPAQLRLAIRQARQSGELSPASAERLDHLINGRAVAP